MWFTLTPTTHKAFWDPFIKHHMTLNFLYKTHFPLASNCNIFCKLQDIFMALPIFVTAFLLAVVLAKVELSTSHVLKGKVSCLDCDAAYDLSGIVVMAKCDEVGKVVTATTAKDGCFEAELPSDDCVARLAGGPHQLYAARKSMVAGIVRAGDGSAVYGISPPLGFYTACGSISGEADKYCKAAAAGRKFGSSKTFDLPLPPEWGLAPSSYYFPFFPIIGIP